MSKSLFVRLKQIKKRAWKEGKMTRETELIGHPDQINIFESVDILEPHCPKCKSKLDYGVNTSYNDKIETHICNECGTVLK